MRILPKRVRKWPVVLAMTFTGVLMMVGCGDDPTAFSCEITDATIPDELLTVGCTGDFTALSYATSDGSLPGSHSVKVMLDLADHDKTHFENTNRFINHHG